MLAMGCEPVAPAAVCDAGSLDANIDSRLPLRGVYARPPAWTATTLMPLGTLIRPTSPNGRYYMATTEGTTGSTEPAWSSTTGATRSDGTVVWTDQGVTSVAIGDKDDFGRSNCTLIDGTGASAYVDTWAHNLPAGRYVVRISFGANATLAEEVFDCRLAITTRVP